MAAEIDRAAPNPAKKGGSTRWSRLLVPVRRLLGHYVFSSLTRRILVLNLAALCMMVAGFLYINQFRDGLVQARIESLRTQGEIIAGANAQKAAPSQAGPRDFTTTRESRKYQDTPVAARPRVRKIRKDQRGPAQSVIGVSGSETDNTDVLAMRLTTSGTFIRSEVNG